MEFAQFLELGLFAKWSFELVRVVEVEEQVTTDLAKLPDLECHRSSSGRLSMRLSSPSVHMWFP